MFRFDIVFGTALVLLAATVLALVGAIGVPALCWTFVLAVIAVTGALMLADRRDRGVRTAGAAFLGVAALLGGLAVLVSPAHAAEAGIVAPPGDTGLWGFVNPYLAEGIATVVAAAVTWAAGEIASHTRIKIRADQEAQIRETLKTGLYVAAQKFELAIGEHWTPAQQSKVVTEMKAWVEQRAASQIKKLGLPNIVVDGMAHKVLGQLSGVLPGAEAMGLDILGGLGGNPGETPALDRAAGGAGVA